MKATRQIVLIAAAVLGLGHAAAQAGPCTGKSAAAHDAGSGPTVGSTGSTVGTNAGSGEHPPTGAMNRQASSSAASSEDAQKQMQGQPTAAQQAEGAKAAPGKTAGNDC